MKEFGFSAPGDIGEALKLMADYGDKATVLAGGTDLVPMINNYDMKPQNLLYIGRLRLDYIKEEPGRLVIGAATTAGRLAANDAVARLAPALCQAAVLSGSTGIQNLATVGGNLVNASPAADLAKAAEEGIKICVEQIEELKEMKGVHGIHLMAIEWEHRVPEIAERAKLLPRPKLNW